MDHATGATPSKSNGPILWIAIAATIYSSTACWLTRLREQNFYALHAEQKTLILRIPAELKQVEGDISQEQNDLTRIQTQIRARLGQK